MPPLLLTDTDDPFCVVKPLEGLLCVEAPDEVLPALELAEHDALPVLLDFVADLLLDDDDLDDELLDVLPDDERLELELDTLAMGKTLQKQTRKKQGQNSERSALSLRLRVPVKR